MTKPKAIPYPEIVTGDTWSVLEVTDTDPVAKTDNLNKQMYVPVDRECEYCGVNHSRMIRKLQLAHAKWSPKTIGKLKDGTRQDCVVALEQLRVSYLLGLKAKSGISDNTKCTELITAETKRLLEHGSIADLILHLINNTYVETVDGYSHSISTQSSSIKAMYRDAIDDDSPFSDYRKSEIMFAHDTATKFIAMLIRHKWNQPPAYRKVQRLAARLSEILNMFIDKPDPDEVFKRESQQNGSCDNTTEDGNECSDDEQCESCSEKSESEEETSGSGSAVESLEKRMRKELGEKLTYSTTNQVGRWGSMEIHTPPLSVNLQARLKNSRAYRPSDFGYNPKYINRWCVDKKIFKQKLNVKGGTILIDASGSMDFSGEDILEIMKLLPAVNIAMYNGSYNHGDLRIIAKNGMRVNDTYLEKHSGRGNVVDGPALEWLATMPARRIWVSDMHVFGAEGGGGSSAGYNLIKECYDICTKHKIINLKDVEEVKEHALKLNQVL